MCLQYMNEIYKTTNQNNTVNRNSILKLLRSLRTTTLTQKCLLCLRPLILPVDVKLSNNVNMLKHKLKKSFLTLFREKYQDIYV